VPVLKEIQGTDCYVTFDVNGLQMEFCVPMDIYIQLEEESEGLLVYRGEQFKRFVPWV